VSNLRVESFYPKICLRGRELCRGSSTISFLKTVNGRGTCIYVAFYHLIAIGLGDSGPVDFGCRVHCYSDLLPFNFTTLAMIVHIQRLTKLTVSSSRFVPRSPPLQWRNCPAVRRSTCAFLLTSSARFSTTCEYFVFPFSISSIV